ncbi:MAG: PHP domain-containing protein [candidate division KSB1 bacterium]|nr:PHP domain-containing protein [candidate division KSB1 bacterium]MDZ7303535.1 PHP domain-containing protein [candidate division KSB1 bacterium]MDZ7312663.1 PHP domain-containing protein [candidate division KSB1 bacterium]
MLREYVADLHIHTCLSPCGDLDMSPRDIVRTARSRGIDMIAICDHNTAENIEAVMRAARGHELAVLPGMEVTSQEEVHILALFENLADALTLQSVIYAHLPGENDEEAFGLQVVVNEFSEVLSFNRKLLIGATDLSISAVVAAIHRFGGLAVAAHIDREGFGIIGQIGFIPKDLQLDALEISPRMTVEEARKKFEVYSDYTFISSSDAHFIEHIGQSTTRFMLTEPSLGEIKKALRREDGRMIIAPVDKSTEM